MSENPVFQAGEPGDDPPPRRSKRAKRRQQADKGSLAADVAEEAGGCLFEGCLWSIVTLPIKVIGWIIGAIVD